MTKNKACEIRALSLLYMIEIHMFLCSLFIHYLRAIHKLHTYLQLKKMIMTSKHLFSFHCIWFVEWLSSGLNPSKKGFLSTCSLWMHPYEAKVLELQFIHSREKIWILNCISIKRGFHKPLFCLFNPVSKSEPIQKMIIFVHNIIKIDLSY